MESDNNINIIASWSFPVYTLLYTLEPTALHRMFTMIDYCIVTVCVCAFYIIIITKFFVLCGLKFVYCMQITVGPLYYNNNNCSRPINIL